MIRLIKFFFFFFFFLNSCKKYTSEELLGVYVNYNYEYPSFIPEIPNIADTLTLKQNSRFVSNHWGEGKYQLENTLKGSHIRLIYNYDFGQGSYRAKLARDDFRKPKIVMFEDNDHYYKKIK